MTINELKEKIRKAEEAVAKAEKTIARHEAQAKKKLDIINKNGWEMDSKKYAQAGDRDAWWAIVDYGYKQNDIYYANKKLEEKKKTLENWKKRLVDAEEKENTFADKIPDSMKEMRDQLVETWDKNDHDWREHLMNEYREMGYEKFIKKHKAIEYDFMRYGNKETDHEKNFKSATAYVLDLYNRINAITGDVKEWSGIHNAGASLNGIVKGKLGTARVETILAGGWNIQRLHCRTLVHKVG
jgi:hypothetical protein